MLDAVVFGPTGPDVVTVTSSPTATAPWGPSTVALSNATLIVGPPPAEAARASAPCRLAECLTRSLRMWRLALMLTTTPETRVVWAPGAFAIAAEEQTISARTVAQAVRNRRFASTG